VLPGWALCEISIIAMLAEVIRRCIMLHIAELSCFSMSADILNIYGCFESLCYGEWEIC